MTCTGRIFPLRVDEPGPMSAFPPVMRAKRTQGRGALRKILEMAKFQARISEVEQPNLL
jgi:hypothetical protein